MKDLLNNGFQIVSEKEMVMVEGGGLNYLDFWYCDTESLENEDGTRLTTRKGEQPIERR